MKPVAWSLSIIVSSIVLSAAPADAGGLEGYDALLHRHVHDGAVDYRALAQPQARQALRAYLTELAAAQPSRDKQQRLAGWINAYNALVLEGILNGGSPASLLGRYRFFRQARHKAFGRELSLEAIENEVIRKTFAEPRIHFALVCASKSCPPLRAEAYVGAQLDAQLDDQGRRFLADATKNRFDRAQKTLYLSSIFDWYKGDFVQAAGSVPQYIAPLAPASERDWVTRPGIGIKILDYDWSLNGTR